MSHQPANISEMYRAFAALAADRGFAKSSPERRTLRDRTTITVASDVGSASQPLKKSFFQSSTQPNRCIRSQDPKIVDGSGLSKDTLLGVFGIGLRFNHQNYVGTLTESREVLDALGDSVLEVRVGSDVLVELTGNECIVGSPGFENHTDTATATTTIRTSIDQKSEPFYLEWPRVITDQAQVAADLFVNKTTWTANDDVNIFLELLVWVARQGSPTASSARLA